MKSDGLHLLDDGPHTPHGSTLPDSPSRAEFWKEGRGRVY